MKAKVRRRRFLLGDEGLGERGRLMDDLSLLLPVLSRELGKPWPRGGLDVAELTGCPVGFGGSAVAGGLSPGHVQVIISLSEGARSVGAIADEIGVSSPAVTQLVDRLVEYGMVERRHDERDRRVVLVDYVEEMRPLARSLTSVYRSHLEELVGDMTDEEMRAFVKGIRLLITGAGNLQSSIRKASENEISGGKG